MSKLNGVKKQKVKLNQEPSEKQPDVVNVLKVLLADEAVLYTRLRNYHWNITGANFYSLHAALESQFYEIADMTDVIAERIRQYGIHAPGTMGEFIQTARLSEAPAEYPGTWTMMANLVSDHDFIIRCLLADIETLSVKPEDVGVVDLLTGLLQQHEKMAWMLRMCMEGHVVNEE